jgi:hypothetical protein
LIRCFFSVLRPSGTAANQISTTFSGPSVLSTWFLVAAGDRPSCPRLREQARFRRQPTKERGRRQYQSETAQSACAKRYTLGRGLTSAACTIGPRIKSGLGDRPLSSSSPKWTSRNRGTCSLKPEGRAREEVFQTAGWQSREMVLQVASKASKAYKPDYK